MDSPMDGGHLGQLDYVQWFHCISVVQLLGAVVELWAWLSRHTGKHTSPLISHAKCVTASHNPRPGGYT